MCHYSHIRFVVFVSLDYMLDIKAGMFVWNVRLRSLMILELSMSLLSVVSKNILVVAMPLVRHAYK